jgi:uncharacterized protein YkwD
MQYGRVPVPDAIRRAAVAILAVAALSATLAMPQATAAQTGVDRHSSDHESISTAGPARPVARWRLDMLARVNAIRAAAGAAPVRLCPRLDTSAQRYARVLARRGYISHTGPDGSQPWDRMRAAGYFWHSAGENLAAGQQGLRAVTAAWRESAPHLANMVNPVFTDVGFGYSRNDASTYRTYWVQHFGVGGHCSP